MGNILRFLNKKTLFLKHVYDRHQSSIETARLLNKQCTMKIDLPPFFFVLAIDYFLEFIWKYKKKKEIVICPFETV